MLYIRKNIQPVKALEYTEAKNWKSNLISVFGEDILDHISIDPWILDGQVIMMIDTPFRLRTLKKGDYIVQETDGNYYVYPSDLFKINYMHYED